MLLNYHIGRFFLRLLSELQAAGCSLQLGHYSSRTAPTSNTQQTTVTSNFITAIQYKKCSCRLCLRLHVNRCENKDVVVYCHQRLKAWCYET